MANTALSPGSGEDQAKRWGTAIDQALAQAFHKIERGIAIRKCRKCGSQVEASVLQEPTWLKTVPSFAFLANGSSSWARYNCGIF